MILNKFFSTCYSDRRDCNTSGIELAELKQNYNESPFDFYGKLLKNSNLQIAYLNNNITQSEAIILEEYSKKFSLRVPLRNLREPVGSLMRTKNSAHLSWALNMLTNDFQFDFDRQLFSCNCSKTFSRTKTKTKLKGTNNTLPQTGIIPDS